MFVNRARFAGVPTSRRSVRPATDRFEAFSDTRYPLPNWLPVLVALFVLIATYTLLPSVVTAGALPRLIVRIVVSPAGARLAAVTNVAWPATSMRARPLANPPTSEGFAT